MYISQTFLYLLLTFAYLAISNGAELAFIGKRGLGSVRPIIVSPCLALFGIPATDDGA